jgi:DNA-binding transcriptional MocR family regulator
MMNAFAADFRPERDINLGVGYVNERTIPIELIRDALENILKNPARYKTPFNYGGPRGSATLTQSILDFIMRSGRGGLTQDNLRDREIIIGASGVSSLLEAMAQVLQPGIVITADPMYYIYCNLLERMGFEIIAIPEDAEGMRTDLLRDTFEKLGERCGHISFFYIVSVNNPTSTILSNQRRREIVEAAAELSPSRQRAIPVLFDTAYDDIIHDPACEKPCSALLFDDLGIVYEVGSLSKILSPALRIGYLIGSPGPLLNALIQKTADTGFSAPLFSQEIASYLLDHHIEDQITRVNRGYHEKALLVKGWIERELGPRLEDCTGGSAAFYFYLTFKDIVTNENSLFFKFLTRTLGNPEIDGPENDKHARVLYVPGCHCVHPRGSLRETGLRQLRISYAFEEPKRIEQALTLMREAVCFCSPSPPG